MIWPAAAEGAGQRPVRATLVLGPLILLAAAAPLAAPWLPERLCRDILEVAGLWPAHVDSQLFRFWQPWTAVLVCAGWIAWLWAALWLPGMLIGCERRLGWPGLLAAILGSVPLAAVGGLAAQMVSGDPRPVGTGLAALSCALAGVLWTTTSAARVRIDALWTTGLRAGISTVVRLDPPRTALVIMLGDGLRAVALGQPVTWPALLAAFAAGALQGLVLRR